MEFMTLEQIQSCFLVILRYSPIERVRGTRPSRFRSAVPTGSLVSPVTYTPNRLAGLLTIFSLDESSYFLIAEFQMSNKKKTQEG